MSLYITINKIKTYNINYGKVYFKGKIFLSSIILANYYFPKENNNTK